MNYPKPRRRWFQFSLKTLLIVMVFAAGYFAGMGTFMRQAQQAREEAIRSKALAED